MTQRAEDQLPPPVVMSLGLMPYQETYLAQKKEVEKVLSGAAARLIICEHPAVLTLGRLAREEHILTPREELKRLGVEVFSIDRGGEVTLHCPGQLVVYPILDLKYYGKDLHWYLRQLEQVAIDLLQDFGIVADRFPGRTGVWVDGKKIVSIGVGVRKWVTFHGLALNVSTDLKLFSLIRPCGLDVRMTSLEKVLGKPVDMSLVKERLARAFGRCFRMGAPD
ncbi:MAG: lipoyl(octanoyl) transferase LipB [Candidatus Omnitrophota bacterium]|nr:lipoyl(octanoyl) transferase LipB [Candidatus Omnitrophota bacterium]MDZ4241305.1 lipoyl(octanoyl) transferase LipB [Candidatus Omnitrophota bacterium]